ncbi:MAG: tryptophanyl-tRNA synthetase [Thermoleophilia bacterium]|nr:tryptophanyl-tRNA synthetase [Thermoleophilia bacterium]
MRILSGIQPTGDKHIGNLIGALRHYGTNQELGEAFYFIADLHALTLLPDPAELRRATLSTAAMVLAAGVDPERATLFVQSHIAAQHTQMTWVLQCVANMGELNRMTQYKDKTDGKNDGGSVGLFTYPVLQAADIVLYDADHVPVGHDQKQHLELSRNLAQRFNNRYGAGTLVVPEPLIAQVGGRVRDLQDPTKKMSTSTGSAKGTVWITDEPAAVLKKFKSAVTDGENEVRFDLDAKPGIANLLELMHIATGTEIAALEAEYGSAGYGHFKGAVGEAMVAYLEPIRARYLELVADEPELLRILGRGADRAAEVASATLARSIAKTGLLKRG